MRKHKRRQNQFQCTAIGFRRCLFCFIHSILRRTSHATVHCERVESLFSFSTLKAAHNESHKITTWNSIEFSVQQSIDRLSQKKSHNWQLENVYGGRCGKCILNRIFTSHSCSHDFGFHDTSCGSYDPSKMFINCLLTFQKVLWEQIVNIFRVNVLWHKKYSNII